MFKFWDLFTKSKIKERIAPDDSVFQRKYRSFRALMDANNRALEIIADLEHHFYQDKPFTLDHIVMLTESLISEIFTIVEDLNALCAARYADLFDVAEQISVKTLADLVRKKSVEKTSLVYPLEQLSRVNAGYVGGKAANLGEVFNRVHLPVPPGFAVSAYACLHFLEKNGLAEYIKKQLKGIDVNDTERLIAVGDQIRLRILQTRLPADLSSALLDAMQNLKAQLGDNLRLAVRSSATSEDSESSFAGQHATVLNVSERSLTAAYREVVASMFSPRAIFYRRSKGYADEDVVMSIACIAMIDARCSGVLYTVDPNDSRRPVMLISAVWGLAALAVEGSVATDYFEADKQTAEAVQRRVVMKAVQLRTDVRDGVIEKPVPADLQSQPCLNAEQISLLVDYGRRLEAHYQEPLDIEWAINESGTLYILQARSLKRAPHEAENGYAAQKPDHPLPGQTVLLQGGSPACEGTANGLAYVLRNDHMLHHVPEGAIVVLRETSPRYVTLMGRVAAIITDVGSVTGHMASVAREFRIPTLVGTVNGTRDIEHGREITVDATHGIIYQGRIEDLLSRKRPLNPMKDSPIYKAAQAALQRIAPLNLTDTGKENFKPAGCQTIHDIIRFAHEMAMKEMFSISDGVRPEKHIAIPLRVKLPLNIHLIDLGNGLHADFQAHSAQRSDICSIPLNALLDGMFHEAVDWSRDVGVNWGGFASIIGQSMMRDPTADGSLARPSYVVVSKSYMNWNSRLGYHFATIDTYCGPLINDNYITFYFKGGAADIGRRSRRAVMIADILKALGVSVEKKADRVQGRLKKYDQQRTSDKLNMLGRLLGSVRLLDMVLSEDRQVEWYVSEFMKGNYAFKN
jgi:pyruvate, water dikinase